MVAMPVLPPWQFTLVCDPMLALSTPAGCEMTTVCVVLHPRTSVTVQVHVPAVRLLAVGLLCAGDVFQL